MKITLVAQDMAPSQALGLIADKLSKNGHFAMSLLGNSNTPPSHGTICTHVANSRAIVVGMSSSKELAQPELYALEVARNHGIPAFCYADTYGAHNRPWFEELLAGTTLFHISESEADKARSLLPKTNVIATGNPMWDDFFFPKFTRAEVQEKLALTAEHKAVLCPGGKSAAVNVLHFSRTIELCSDIQNLVVFLSLHPGDKTDPAVYQELVDLAPVPGTIVPKELLSAPDMLPGINLVIESASTIGIEAACQRIPVVDYFSSLARARLKKTTGSDQWPLCGQVAHDLDIYHGFEVELVKDLLAGGGHKKLFVQNAEKMFPAPKEKGAAIRSMVAAIEQASAA